MSSEDTRGVAREASGRRRLAWLVPAVALFVATRIATVYTEAINWDEFALFASADRVLHSGMLRTGGHLGLETLLVLPIAEGCSDEIAVVHTARLLWLGLTGAFLLGLAALLGAAQPDPRRRFWDAAVGVGLLALLPVFLEWSIQVRADQIALAAGVWAGAALLAARRRASRGTALGLAFLSGTLFGVGWLGSRKVAYVAALVGALALGRIWRERSRAGAEMLARDALRALACAAGFVAVFYTYRAALEAAPIELPAGHGSEKILSGKTLRSGISVFDYYRRTIGYSQYTALLPTLGAHFAMLGALVAATAAAARRRVRADSLPIAWAVLAVGVGVGWFHAAAFSYFAMTLGLFPAVAFAVSRWDIQRLLLPPSGRARTFAVTGWWLLLALPGAGAALGLLADSQRVQRESLAFVHENFGRSAAGFHPEGSLFCQEGTQPLGTFFSQTIFYNFAVSESLRERRIDDFLTAHRETPVQFLVQSFRLNQFPQSLRRFWADNYQPYRGSVFVAGRHLEGARGTTSRFELIVPGAYRWIPKTGPQPIWIERVEGNEPVGARPGSHATHAGGTYATVEGPAASPANRRAVETANAGRSGRRVEPGEVVTLEPGQYAATFIEDVPAGLLVLAVNDPPGPAPQLFYKLY